MPVTPGVATRLSPTAGTTAPVLVKNVLRETGSFPISDIHTNSLTSSSTSLTVADATQYQVGDVLSWIDDDSYEDALVTAASGVTLTVRRAHRFTTAAAHLANAIFHVNVRHIPHVVNQALSDSIAGDLYPDVYAVYFASATPASPHDPWFVVPAAFERPLYTYQKSNETPAEILPLKFSFPRYIDTTFAATGRALRVPSLANSNSVFLVWAQKPGIDDLTVTQARIVEYGTLRRLAEWEETEASGTDSIQQGGVLAPGSFMRDARFYAARQAELINAEVALLDNLYPRQNASRWIGRRHISGPK